MRQATVKKETPDLLISHITQRLREALMIVFFAIASFLLLSLITYNPNDPAWSHSYSTAIIMNAGGRTGAFFADVSLYLFGFLAVLFPAIVAFSGFLLYRARLREHTFEYSLLAIRTGGFVLTLVAGCAISSMHLIFQHSRLPFGAGGILGDVVGRALVDQFNYQGSTLLVFAGLLMGITLATGLSWLRLIDTVGLLSWRLLVKSQRLALAFMAKCRELRIQYLLKQHEKSVAANTASSRIAVISPKSITKPKAKPIISIDKSEPETERLPVAIATPNLIVPQPKVKKERPISLGGFPSFDLLESPDGTQIEMSPETLAEISQLVEIKLADFGIEVEVVGVHPGPVITRFELKLAPGIKVSKITTLAKDLARSLAVISVRVVEVIPGKPVVGLELPNPHRQIVRLQEVLISDEYARMSSPLALALGKDISGLPVVVDLAKMPHLLVAGTTGSGKSVGVNGMLLSVLYKAQPEEVRLILIDPKMLELAVYDGIPHLLAPVVTDMKEASNALRWCVAEMERRYQLMAALGVRNLTGYNRKVKDAIKSKNPIPDPLFLQRQAKSGDTTEEVPTLETMPFIVVVIDEFADMIMVVGKKVEELIARIAQKARAAGIHLILATQRPSVDVITGLIKANVPTRIAFQVASRIDSRTILDQQGAEQLLGRGDMLYLPIGAGIPIRVHGAFVDDHEVHEVVSDWKKRGEPNYCEDILQGLHSSAKHIESAFLMGDDSENDDYDPLYDEAVVVVTESRRASISLVQRRLKIGYNRAARLVECMEEQGVVSAMQSNGSREVLAPPPV